MSVSARAQRTHARAHARTRARTRAHTQHHNNARSHAHARAHSQVFSCKYLYERGLRDDGPQLITVKGRDGRLTQVQLYCDMANGGWTLVGEIEGWFDMYVWQFC